MANGIGSSLDASLPEQIESRRAEHRRTLYSSATYEISEFLRSFYAFPPLILEFFALSVNYFLAQKGFYLLENNTNQINLELRTPQVRDQVLRG
ncbi:hypothetical protein NC652_037276 [Populus alba x Populus x berolinensis]|nr:hypothetical protein NC652_037276 [Populus alba x Populus x berolinensis]